MAKYDQSLGNLKDQISGAKNILIALPSQINPDKLAAGLALYLSLKQSGKEASIVTSDTLKVSHTNLFGVGSVSSALPQTSGGNLVITLEGVVTDDGQVPGLEKLDWYPKGPNLNLVFHTIPGQKFEPAKISPSYQGGSFDLVFVLGASTLADLGEIYTNNQNSFSAGVVNIDGGESNSLFGSTNVVDPGCSLSEITAQVLPSLGLPVDPDIASNLLVGIYDFTINLTTKTRPDTFLAVGYCLQVGGKNPLTQTDQVEIHGTSPEQGASASLSDVPTVEQFPPFNQVFGFPAPAENQPGGDSLIPNVAVTPTPVTPSPEERPSGEGALEINSESNPDPSWLSPKVFSVNNK